MDKEYIEDLKHLIDISKTKVNIEVSNRFEYMHPIDVIKYFYPVIKHLRDNIERYEVVMKFDRKVLDSLVSKLENNKESLCELDRYINYANDKLKEDKGWTKNDCVQVGLPKEAFEVTVEELIVFYNCLELLESYYPYISKDIVIPWSIESHFKYMNDLKGMLEKRLAFAIIGAYAKRHKKI